MPTEAKDYVKKAKDLTDDIADLAAKFRELAQSIEKDGATVPGFYAIKGTAFRLERIAKMNGYKIQRPKTKVGGQPSELFIRKAGVDSGRKESAKPSKAPPADLFVRKSAQAATEPPKKGRKSAQAATEPPALFQRQAVQKPPVELKKKSGPKKAETAVLADNSEHES